MSTYASHLCVLLVDNLYGELTSRIFRFLLRDGRLSIPALRYHTGLSLRQVQHGLSVLVQQQLVFWYTSAEDSTVYEANTAVAYNLLRAGKFVQLAEEQLGNFAAVIVSNLLLLGHARVGDLVQAYGLDRTEGVNDPTAIAHHQPSTNGIHDGSMDTECPSDNERISLASVHTALRELLGVGFVSLVNESYFRSEADNRTEAGKAVPPPEYFRAKSKRDNEAQRETTIQEKLDEWKYGTKAEKEQYGPIMNVKKRQLDDSSNLQAEKRRRLHLPSNGHDVAWTAVNTSKLEGAKPLSNDLVLCINYDRFAVTLRNESLIALADETICKSTSRVYAEVLRKLETNTRACKENPEVPDIGDGPELGDLPYVSTDDLVHVVKDSKGLIETLGKVEGNGANAKEVEHPKKRRKKKEFNSDDEALVVGDASPDEDEEEESDSEDGDESSDSEQANGAANYSLDSLSKAPEDRHRRSIRDHLLLLAKHPYSFLQHIPETSVLPERWTVQYQPLMKSIIHHVLLQIIATRYGQPAARLTRLLSDRGKVDEKNLCSLSLINQKSMRSYLTTLHKAGMIQLQEIPRDNSRNPQRTLYLWYFDAERCKAEILQESYKTMVRCLQRVQVEENKVKGTLEKATRSDVIGREEEFLGVQEREALEKWRQVEERIWGELGRLDELVGILRDF